MNIPFSDLGLYAATKVSNDTQRLVGAAILGTVFSDVIRSVRKGD